MDRQPLTDRLGDRLLAEYGGAAAAYSLRALNGNGDSVVRVRRASDNDEKDFTAEQIELGEMVDWVTEGSATADGFVETWYDQSGNGNDATQSVAASQPKIVDGGSLVADGIKFDGVDDSLTASYSRSGEDLPLSMFAAFEQEVEGTDYVVALGLPNGNSFDRLLLRASSFEYARRDTAGLVRNYNASDPNVNTKYLFTAINEGTVSSAFVNGLSIFASEDTNVGTQFMNQIYIGAFNGDGLTNANPFDGTIQEIIIYPSDQSATRTAIEGNINAHYNIYP